MLQIIKRDGSKVDFNEEKIVNAVLAAFEEVDGTISDYAMDKAGHIADYIKKYAEKVDYPLDITEIQNLTERGLMSTKRRDVAKAYILYRNRKDELRLTKKNLIAKYNQLEDLINGKDEDSKKENSNKDTRIIPTMRDYIAGFTCREVADSIVLPEEISNAHKKGIIHFHDTDYSPVMPMYNCFDRNTSFVTINGKKSFNDFNDGDKIQVLSLDGKYHNAIVKKYGKQKLYKYTFYNGKKEFTTDVIATENHRWILKDGKETTSLKIGDKLIKAPKIYTQDLDWDTLTYEEQLMWCKGFGLGDGTVEYIKKDYPINSTRIRLCGEKDLKFIKRFNIKGCKIRETIFNNGDKNVVIYNYHKEIPKFNSIKELQCFFNGLYCADGRMKKQGTKYNFSLQSSKKEVIDFVRQYADTIGLYITREKDLTGQSTNYTKSRPYTINFSFNPDFSFSYTVLNKQFEKEEEVWCLEVEETHNFILEHGIPTGNCSLINLEDMLQNGTVISGVLIEKPHKFSTACTITTQIITQVASSQYGGNTVNIAHLAPFVEATREKYKAKKIFNDSQVEALVKEDIQKGIQTIQYQLITMSTTNGQAPFTSLFMYLGDAKTKQEEKDLALIIEEILHQRIIGVKNEQGVPITTAFPKLLYVLDENNIHEDSEYYYLTELAAECTSKRLVPDYISAKRMRELKGGDVFGCMGCRSFLSPDLENHKYWGRFNQGVVTINLPHVALSADCDLQKFWELLDKRLELCYKALMLRHNRLKGVKSDVAPILWQHGAIARLKQGETIDKLLYNGYSTISLGYAGLWETVYALCNKTLIDPEGKKLGLEIMKYLDDKCNLWKNQTNIGFSTYGSPIESTTYKFAKALKRDFGEIKGVSDKNYVTNSYHITPSQEISAFDKLTIENEFQELSLGGAISYVETPNMIKNTKALLEIIQHIYNTIMYAEINTMTSYCKQCGCTDIKMGDDLKFHCPNCGNEDFNKMNIALRICGYISTNPFNDGRAQDIHDRVYHIGNE